MRRFAVVSVIGALFVGAAAPLVVAPSAASAVAQPAAAQGTSAATRVRDVSGQLETIRAKHNLPSLAAVVIKGGKVVGEGAVGLRRVGGNKKVTTHDKWHLGSCTKAMTATLCAVLVEEGKLSWDSTVEQVLPDLAAVGRPEYRGVTLRDLLTHRGGFVANLPAQGTFRLNANPLPEQRRAYARMLLTQPPEKEPRTAFHYSNAGYTLAGAMAEAATGKAWEDLMREKLFKPLGMESAGFGPPSTGGRLDEPWGHAGSGTKRKASQTDNPAVIGPAGTVHCTLGDWAKFVDLHMRGMRGEEGLLLKPESFKALHQPPEGETYALGWGVAERDWAGKPSGIALTHAGSNTMWFAIVWAAPERDAAVLVATNVGDAGKACDDAAVAMIKAFFGN